MSKTKKTKKEDEEKEVIVMKSSKIDKSISYTTRQRMSMEAGE